MYLLYQIQVSRRLYEVLKVHKFSEIRSSFLSTAFASSYYFLVPLTYVELLYTEQQTKKESNFLLFIFMIFIFFFANLQQHHSHKQLADLRKDKSNQDKFYQIPKEGLFKYFYCPHYLMEISIYFSLLLLNFSPSLLLVFLFVLCNQIELYHNTREWYKKKFGK